MSSSVTFKIILSNIVVAALVATYMSSGSNNGGSLRGARELQGQIPLMDPGAAISNILASAQAIGITSTLQSEPQIKGALSQVDLSPGSFIQSNLFNGSPSIITVGSSSALIIPDNAGLDNGTVSAVAASPGAIIPQTLVTGAVVDPLPILIQDTAAGIIALASAP